MPKALQVNIQLLRYRCKYSSYRIYSALTFGSTKNSRIIYSPEQWTTHPPFALEFGGRPIVPPEPLKFGGAVAVDDGEARFTDRAEGWEGGLREIGTPAVTLEGVLGTCRPLAAPPPPDTIWRVAVPVLPALKRQDHKIKQKEKTIIQTTIWDVKLRLIRACEQILFTILWFHAHALRGGGD